jgi:hypothetical protein
MVAFLLHIRNAEVWILHRVKLSTSGFSVVFRSSIQENVCIVPQRAVDESSPILFSSFRIIACSHSMLVVYGITSSNEHCSEKQKITRCRNCHPCVVSGKFRRPEAGCYERFSIFFLPGNGWAADHSGRAVWGVNCLRLLERWDRRGCVCARLFCVCAALCVGSGLATGWSPVQGVYRIKKQKKRPESNKMTIEP